MSCLSSIYRSTQRIFSILYLTLENMNKRGRVHEYSRHVVSSEATSEPSGAADITVPTGEVIFSLIKILF